MATVKILSEESILALRRDHEQLRYEVRNLRALVRAVHSQIDDRGKRLFCRFTLGAALATTDASKSATITNQYGYGRAHTSTSITVYNALTHAAGVYEYVGDSGDAGKAFFDPVEGKWHIFDMECP
jgi:hypothetical protein